MPAPYRTDEIARALRDEAGRAGRSLADFQVVADEKEQVWIVRIRAPEGGFERLAFPFSSRRGIYTPTEIATHLLRKTWPFR